MNRPVSVQDPFGMRHVATRVALLMERQNPPMSVDGLAKRMTENGCPRFARQTWYRMIDPDKPQSVDADELLAFSRVFRVSMDSLMLDPAAEVAEAVTAAAVEWEQAIAEVRTKRLDLLDAQQRADEARRKLARLATTDDSRRLLADLLVQHGTAGKDAEFTVNGILDPSSHGFAATTSTRRTTAAPARKAPGKRPAPTRKPSTTPTRKPRTKGTQA